MWEKAPEHKLVSGKHKQEISSWRWNSISSDLTQDDMLRAHHKQVAFKLPANFLLDAVVHVWRVIWIELIDENLFRQLDSKTVSVDGDLFHQLTTLDPH